MTTNSSVLIEVRNLVKYYGSVRALDGLTLQLEKGRVVGLLGENGCGKSTLMRILMGLNQPSSGTVSIAGHAPGAETKRIVSYLPDASQMPKGVRIAYLIEHYEDFYPDFNRETCENMLADMGIALNSKFGELSKGQGEKVQVALTMSREAEIYLLDEPISGVDPAARETTLRAIIQAIRPEALVIVATHLVNEIEPILDEVILMRHGNVLTSGTVDELRERSNKSLNDYFKEVYSS